MSSRTNRKPFPKVSPPAVLAGAADTSADSSMALLREGLEHHRSGRLREAFACYRQVLEFEPAQPDAHNLLGMLTQQAGNAPLAITFLERAVELDPGAPAFWLNLGRARMAAGRTPEALQALERAILLGPDSAPAHALFGVALQASGRLGDAQVALERAIAIEPNFAPAHCDLGGVHHAAGRLTDAIACYTEALRLDPELVDAHANLGSALADAGRIEPAVTAYRRALALQPTHYEALINLGMALQGLGDLEEAARLHQAAGACRPDAPEPWLNLGTIRYAEGRFEDARHCFETGLSRRPDSVPLILGVGNTYKAEDRLEQALECYDRALALLPEHPQALVNRGNTLTGLGRFDEALGALRRAIEVKPDMVEAHISLGVALKGTGDFDAAIDAYRVATRIAPEKPEAYFNIGNGYRESNRPLPAIDAYQAALAIRPAYGDAHWNLGLTLLQAGRLAEGWAEYAWRFRSGDALADVRPYPFPRWRGEPLAGRRILVWREQGIGDELLFAPCIADLVRLGADVRVLVTDRLVGMLQRAFPSATVLVDDGGTGLSSPEAVPFDFHAPIGDLPRYLRATPEAFPPSGEYLAPIAARADEWRARLAELGEGLRVGICWRSGRLTAERRVHYSSLAEWGAVFRLPRVHWINLQYDDCDQEIHEAEAMFGIRIHRWDGVDLRNDLEGVLGLLSQLDAVISAPTAVTALAGGIGVPTWQADSGAEWATHGHDHSLWFPVLQVVTRPLGAPWSAVMETIASRLSEPFVRRHR